MKTENTSWKDPKATTDQLLRSMCESLHWLNVNMERLITNTDKLLKAQTAEQTLAERRKKDAERQARHRMSRDNGLTEREGEEQENIPPTPPIREKEDQEKDFFQSPRDELAKEAEKTFNDFWAAYPGPRKIDKKKCRRVFLRLAKEHGYEKSFYDAVFAGLDRWKVCHDWTDKNGAFVCAPLAWLNNERWEDEVKSVAPVVDMRNRPDNYLAPSAEAIEEIKKLF